MVRWVAEPIPHAELARGGVAAPFPGTDSLPGADPAGRSRLPALPARSEGSTCCCASTAPLPPHLIYAAPHFLLISMPLSPLPIFFSPCAACASPCCLFFSLLIACRPPRCPRKLQYLGLPACVHSKWALILPEEGTMVHITPLEHGPSVVRGVFLFYRTSLLWMLLAFGCRQTGGVAAGAHCLHPNIAAGLGAAPAICPLLRSAGLPAARHGSRACWASARACM